MSGRTAFGVNLGFKKLPGGTIATTGPLKVEGGVVADSGSFAGPLSVGGDVVADDALFAGTVRASGYMQTLPNFADHLASRGMEIDIHSSSSGAQVNRPVGVITRQMKTMATGAAADFSECWSGILRGALDKGCPLHVEYNSGGAAETTSQILAGMWSDLANPLYPKNIRTTILGLLANDLPAGTDPDTLESLIDAAVNRLLYEFGRERVVLLMPHTRNPMPATSSHDLYLKADAMLRRVAGRYAGRVRVDSMYDVFCVGGVDTPSGFILDEYGHLNIAGSDKLAPMWMGIANWLGWMPPDARITSYGTPVMRISGDGPSGKNTGYTSFTSCTIAESDENEEGTPRWLITATGGLGAAARLWQEQLFNPARPVVAGKSYRLYVDDLTITSMGTGSNLLYLPGALVRAVSVTPPRSRIYTSSMIDGLHIPVGTRLRRRLGPIFTATPEMAAATQLALYSGDNGYAIKCSYVDILEVPE